MKQNCKSSLKLITLFFLFSFLFLNILIAQNVSANKNNKENAKKYYHENKNYIILNLSGTLKAFINKKNQKVYYYYHGRYYTRNKGIWFDSKKINTMFKITKQKNIPKPLRKGPLLMVRRKKISAESGFAAVKVPPAPVKKRLPKAAAGHLYDLPLTMHGLIIYQRKFNFNPTK
jgi:hypothetical protein